MNTKEVAAHLKITVQSLRIWLKIFDIQVGVDANRNRVYSNDVITLLEKIKSLKASGKATNEIRKSLGSTREFTMETTSKTSDNIREIIKAEIQQQNELARDYAKASYIIGQLEAEKKALEEKIKLLPAPDEFNQIKCERDNFQKEKEVLQNQLQQALRENEVFKMPWYKKLFVTLNFAKA